MRTEQRVVVGLAAIALACHGCGGDEPRVVPRVSCGHGQVGPVDFPVTVRAPTEHVSVAAMDRASTRAFGGPSSPRTLGARLLVVTATGDEVELTAIRAVLDHRGTPYDVFVAADEPPLTASRLATGDHGHYQGTILTNASLWVPGGSALDAAEWGVLADYEARFGVRRASLNTWPDPALGFGAWAPRWTDVEPLPSWCTSVGAAVLRDVNCAEAQPIAGAYVYLAPAASAALTPLLVDADGHALAAIHRGADGRETLHLMFSNHEYLPHSLTFLHGVLGWVAGGTYLGERRIDISAQVDDLFLSSDLYGGGEYRIDGADAEAVRAWQHAWRADPQTPGLRLAMAFNAVGAVEGDDLVDAVRDTPEDWHWISHTYTHAYLDEVDYATAFDELELNRQAADALGLVGFDPHGLVTPGVSGLVNPDVMAAAGDVGVGMAVTDSSRPGCDNPSPNTAFFNELAPDILLLPRRPTNLFYNVSTPDEWVTEYNDLYRGYWGYDADYAGVLDHESDVLLLYLLRGEVDPWMFHQANLRAYDGARSLLGDLLDAALAKLARRLTVPVGTPPMHELGMRVADRMRADAAGVRGAIAPGRALLLVSAVPTTVAVTGVRPTDGEAYGGDHVARVAVVPGTTTCVPLDAAGLGCSPAPAWAGEPGPVGEVVVRTCDAGSDDP